MIQFRTMGGVIGLAITITVMNSYLKSNLIDFLSPTEIATLLQTTQASAALPPALREVVTGVFASGYNLQIRIMIGFSAAQIPTTMLMWQKKHILL